MRILTVTREKTFVGCLCTLKLYIEDYNDPEITIQNIPCRMLGTLKNGEMNLFEIPEEEVCLFTVLGTDGACEPYRLPAGVESVTLAGGCRRGGFRGRAFRFVSAGNARRRRSGKGLMAGLIAVMAMVFCVGFIGIMAITGVLPAFRTAASDKTFSGNGYAVTLTDDFNPAIYAGFEALYESNDSAVYISKETFASYPKLAALTVSAYAEDLAVLIEQDADFTTRTNIHTEAGLTYFDYTVDEDVKAHAYRVFIFKGSDAFWTLQVVTPIAAFENMEDDMMEWAKSFRAD